VHIDRSYKSGSEQTSNVTRAPGFNTENNRRTACLNIYIYVINIYIYIYIYIFWSSVHIILFSLVRIYVSRKTAVTSAKELGSNLDTICAEYFYEVQGKVTEADRRGKD
jgi:hypothetical protein